MPGQKYSPRLIAFDEYRRKQNRAFSGRAIPADEHLMILEDHLQISIRRQAFPYPMFKLQMALLLDLIEMERSVAACKSKIEELKAAPDAANQERNIEGLTSDREMYSTFRRALRDIGDGIAWRLLDYDRAALDALAAHPRKQHINLEGLEAELHAFAEIFNEHGTLCVLNDLTHYLKKADLTVRIDESSFEFVEVKSSRTKSGTLSRQRANLTETLRFLSTGSSERGGETFSIASVDIEPHNYFKAVRPLLDEAEETGTASALIGKHLAVEFVDWRRAAKLEPDPGKLERVWSIAER